MRLCITLPLAFAAASFVAATATNHRTTASGTNSSSVNLRDDTLPGTQGGKRLAGLAREGEGNAPPPCATPHNPLRRRGWPKPSLKVFTQSAFIHLLGL